MKYFVRRFTLDCIKVKEIDQSIFDALKDSRELLYSARVIEEKYDLLIQNYLEFEQEVLSKLVENMVTNQIGYDDFYELRSVLNRRIVNFLTSAKLYSDQIQKHVNTCMNDCVNEKVKDFFRDEYDTNFEYRFMEALRNYVQHYCLAVHHITMNSSWERDVEPFQQVNKIKICALKSELVLDKSFKRGVLNEMDNEVDLLRAIRVYMSSFGGIHNKIRRLICDNVNIARDLVQKTIDDYRLIDTGDVIGLNAYSVEGSDPFSLPIETCPVMLDWDDVRLNLQRRNDGVTNLGKRYVSGSCI